MLHSDYITHVKNKEDLVYLENTHFPVNMRLFKTSPEYRALILHCCNYIKLLCLSEKEGYKKPHGMSSANAGLGFNIIGMTVNRGLPGEYCMIMINPEITKNSATITSSESNCGSLTLPNPIRVNRYVWIDVKWFDEDGKEHLKRFHTINGANTLQHEIDHNLGILITDYDATKSQNTTKHLVASPL